MLSFLPPPCVFPIFRCLSKLCLFVTVFLGVLCLFLGLWVKKNFPNVTYEELLFFIYSPLAGCDVEIIKLFLVQCLFPSFSVTFCLVFLKQIVVLISKKYNFFLVLTSLTALFVTAFQLYRYRGCPMQEEISSFYEQHYVSLQNTSLTFPKHKKNLILLFVESLEQTFSDKAFFGESLVPALDKLPGVRFSSYQNGFATGFTQGSLVAAFTGLAPHGRYSSDMVNEDGGYFFTNYLKGVDSLGKILQHAGYQTLYVSGGDSRFAGADVFLKNHGVSQIVDQNVIAQKYPDFVANGWGYEDKDVLQVLKETVEKIAKNQPFAIFTATLDTHAHHRLNGQVTHKSDNYYKDIIYHTDLLVAGFVRWFQNQPQFSDTVVIVVGDHLRMYNDFDMPEKRTIYNLFMNAPEPLNVNRSFTQIDLFPTILEAMGVKIKGHSLGLGVSVFSEKSTLLEEYGALYLQKEMRKNNKLFKKLWSGDDQE